MHNPPPSPPPRRVPTSASAMRLTSCCALGFQQMMSGPWSCAVWWTQARRTTVAQTMSYCACWAWSWSA